MPARAVVFAPSSEAQVSLTPTATTTASPTSGSAATAAGSTRARRRTSGAAYKQLLDYREALENPPLLVVSDCPDLSGFDPFAASSPLSSAAVSPIQPGYGASRGALTARVGAMVTAPCSSSRTSTAMRGVTGDDGGVILDSAHIDVPFFR